MRASQWIRILFIIVILLSSAACAGRPQTPEPLITTTPTAFSVSAIRTQAVGTAYAALTSTARASIPSVTPIPPEPSTTPFPPTRTPLPSLTASDVPTRQIYTPTMTPSQTEFQCGILDIQPVQNATLPINYDFDATVEIQNTGEVTWNAGTIFFMYSEGTKFQKRQGAAILTQDVKPGKAANFIIDMTAPDTPGRYEASWTLRRGPLNFCTVYFILQIVK
jgi:hypothetical protein